MKKIVPLLLACLLPAISSFAQKDSERELPECLIDFPDKRIKVEQDQINQIDSAWDALKKGNRVRLYVLDKNEDKMEDERRFVLSQARCSTMMEYITRKDISVVSYAVSIDPFDKKKKSAMSEASNAGYRNMTNRKGIYSIILYKEGFEPIHFTGSDSMALRWKNCQEFRGDPSATINITGAEGTVIKIQANSLVYMDGKPVNCKQVDICLREYYSKSDMIAAGLTTHSYKRMLVSGGMIHITATCEGQKLRLLSGKPMDVKFPTNGMKKEKGMRTFYGRHQDALTNWLPSIREEGNEIKEDPVKYVDEETGETFDYEGESEDEYSKADYYFMQSSRLGWINCDRFYDVPDKTDLYVKSDTAVKPSVRLVFRDINSVMPGYYYSADKTVKFDDVPKGQTVTAVAVAVKGDKYFYGSEEVVIGKEREISVPVTQMTRAQFEAQVKALD